MQQRHSLYMFFLLLFFIVAIAAIVVMVRPLMPRLPAHTSSLTGAAYTMGDMNNNTNNSWYAPPWDVFTDEQFLSTTPSVDGVNVIVDRPGAYIYTKFYVSHNGSWEAHYFAGSLWQRDHAERRVAINNSFDDREYVIVFTCKRKPDAPAGWDCGCKNTTDNVCRAFAVQSFNKSKTLSLPCASFSSCVSPPPGVALGVHIASPFADVPPAHWGYEYVTAARALGGIAGYANNEFKPEQAISRGEAASMVAKALRLPPAPSATQSFTDVPPSNPFFDDVERVKSAGLMNGYGSNDVFGVEENLTRAQLAVIAAKAMGLNTNAYQNAQTFSDVPTSFWAHDYIEALHTTGVIVGYPDGTYHPTQPATREQAASVIMKSAFGFKNCNGNNCAKLTYDCTTKRLTLTQNDSCIMTPDCTSFSSCVSPPPGVALGVHIASPFADVPPAHWGYEYVTAARALGGIAGYANNEFKPEQAISRGEAASMVAKAWQLPPIPPNTTQSFTDVPPSNPFFDDIERVKSAGLMNGYGSNDVFGVEENLTRAQLAVTAAKAMGLNTSGYDDVQSFPDVPTSFWAHDYIEALHTTGVIVGYPDGTYHPTQPATREQAASVIMKSAFGFKNCNGNNCAKLTYDCTTKRLTLTQKDSCTLP